MLPRHHFLLFIRLKLKICPTEKSINKTFMSHKHTLRAHFFHEGGHLKYIF